MADGGSDSKKRFREFTFKALKAAVKGLLFYGIYFVLWVSVLAPAADFVPGLQRTIETFVAVYIVLMIIGELTAGTIFQFFFSSGKALFMIGYFILSLKGGVWGITIENVNLVIDLRLFLMVAVLLSVLGLAKSILQAINFMNERAEFMHI